MSANKRVSIKRIVKRIHELPKWKAEAYLQKKLEKNLIEGYKLSGDYSK